MIDDSTRSQLRELYTSLYVSHDLDLAAFHTEICALKEKYNNQVCVIITTTGEICPGDDPVSF